MTQQLHCVLHARHEAQNNSKTPERSIYNARNEQRGTREAGKQKVLEHFRARLTVRRAKKGREKTTRQKTFLCDLQCGEGKKVRRPGVPFAAAPLRFARKTTLQGNVCARLTVRNSIPDGESVEFIAPATKYACGQNTTPATVFALGRRLMPPCQCVWRKMRASTRRKYCACHEKCNLGCPKCCACHEKGNHANEGGTESIAPATQSLLRHAAKTRFGATVHSRATAIRVKQSITKQPQKTPPKACPHGSELTATARRDHDETTTRPRRHHDETTTTPRRHDKHHANTGPTPRPPTINGNPSLRIREKIVLA